METLDIDCENVQNHRQKKFHVFTVLFWFQILLVLQCSPTSIATCHICYQIHVCCHVRDLIRDLDLVVGEPFGLVLGDWNVGVEDLQGFQKNLKSSHNFVHGPVEIFKFLIEFLLIFIKLTSIKHILMEMCPVTKSYCSEAVFLSFYTFSYRSLSVVGRPPLDK